MLPGQRLHIPLQPLCSAAIMSQVSVAGGEKVIFGLEPMLTSCMGAGVPQAAPSRIGSAGSATRSRPLRRAAQRARPSSMSLADHSGRLRRWVAWHAGRQHRRPSALRLARPVSGLPAVTTGGGLLR